MTEFKGGSGYKIRNMVTIEGISVIVIALMRSFELISRAKLIVKRYQLFDIDKDIDIDDIAVKRHYSNYNNNITALPSLSYQSTETIHHGNPTK